MNDNLNKENRSCQCANQAKDKDTIKMLPNRILQFIDKCRKEENLHGQLIGVLHRVQDHFGYLSQDAMDAVAHLMQIPAAKVSGVATFYHYFRLKPSGKYVISICLGTACYVKGAEAVLNKFKEELGIKEGETTKDGLFGLELSRCLGACALAPVVKIGKSIHSQVTPDKVPSIIKDLLVKKQEAASDI